MVMTFDEMGDVVDKARAELEAMRASRDFYWTRANYLERENEALTAERDRYKAALVEVFNHPLTHLSGDMEIVVRAALSPTPPKEP